MKRTILIIILIIILVIVAFFGYIIYHTYAPPGKANNVEISIGNSSKFSKEEIESAMQAVIKKFKDFRGGDLKQLWHDDKSNYETVYISPGVAVDESNVIVLYSNFDTDSRSINYGAIPNNTYKNWKWVLIRDNKTSEWKVYNFGYT